MMNQISALLLGALLVAVGVFAGATADRIRHGRAKRAAAAPRTSWRVLPLADWPNAATAAMAADAHAALVASGFTKPRAVEAVAACQGAERATLESWIRAAFRRAGSREVAS